MSVEEQIDALALAFKTAQKRADLKYCSLYDLIRQLGYKMDKIYAGEVVKGAPKSCYYNCFMRCLESKELTYCEGYAIPKSVGLAVSHAWLIDKDKEVQEVTWDEPGVDYYGLAFDTKFIKQLFFNRKDPDKLIIGSVLEDNYLEKWSFLKEGLPKDAYIKQR